MENQLNKYSQRELLFINDTNSVLLVKCRDKSGEPFYAYIKCSRDNYNELKSVKSNKKKIDIHSLGNILFFGFEENPPEIIQKQFIEKA